MSIFKWLLGSGDSTSRQVDMTVERIMILHPHLRLASHGKSRLAHAVETSIHYLGGLIDKLPETREASAAAWASDPYIHAFFATADDVAQVISRSADLRATFERNAEQQEVYAVLGMEMVERHILGVGLEGETLRRDVPQTTLNFSDHQVRMCGRTEAELKREIVRRLLEQLAMEGLARIAADKSRRDMLERERALLKTRLQLLERQGVGMRGMFSSDGAGKSDELAHLQTEMEENQRKLEGLGIKSDALDHELEHVREVFAEPGRHIYLSSRRVKLDRMNIVSEGNSTQAGEEIELHFARIPTTPPRTRTFALVRFARANMLPAKSMLEEAERILASGILS